MILADTSAWIDYLRGNESQAANLLAAAIGRNEILVGDLIAAELLSGFKLGRQLREFETILAGFPMFVLCGETLARKVASNYRALRTKGVTARGIVDVIIATWCIEHAVPLLHTDRDFEPMEKILGLRRWNG